MKHQSLILVLPIAFYTTLAQSQNVSISLMIDTINCKDNLVMIDITFTNNTQEKIYLYFSEDLCINSKQGPERFSCGLCLISLEDSANVLCSNIERSYRSIDFTDKRMNKEHYRELKKKRLGSFFCRTRKILLKPGITRRRYSLSLCEELPKEGLKVQLRYLYYREMSIDYYCLKCYPKRRNKKNIFEGEISSEPIILIKR